MERSKRNPMLLGVLGLVGLVQLFPLYWLITYSLKTNAEILGQNILGLPHIPQFQNYVEALTKGNLLQYFLNSVIYSAFSVFFVGVLSAMCGYAIAKMKWKMSGMTLIYISIGIMIPASAKLLPLFQVLDAVGLKGSALGLVVVYIASQIPFSTMILYGFCRSIPDEIQEAALLDGCNVYKMFFSIIVPIIKPAIATASIFTFLDTWNEFMFAITFLDKNALYTLPVGIRAFSGENQVDLGLVGAGLVIATIPSIIFYFFFSKQIQSGLTDGAVKG